MVRKHDMLSQKDIEEILGMKSIGVIPADDKVIISQNKGVPVLSLHSKSARAFMNAARLLDSPRIIPVDLNAEDPCTKRGILHHSSGKECGNEA